MRKGTEEEERGGNGERGKRGGREETGEGGRDIRVPDSGSEKVATPVDSVSLVREWVLLRLGI